MWLLLIVKLQIRAENANSQDQHHTVMCHLENHGNHGIREIQNPGFSLKTSSFLTVPFFLKFLGSAGIYIFIYTIYIYNYIYNIYIYTYVVIGAGSSHRRI